MNYSCFFPVPLRQISISLQGKAGHLCRPTFGKNIRTNLTRSQYVLVRDIQERAEKLFEPIPLGMHVDVLALVWPTGMSHWHWEYNSRGVAPISSISKPPLFRALCTSISILIWLFIEYRVLHCGLQTTFCPWEGRNRDEAFFDYIGFISPSILLRKRICSNFFVKNLDLVMSKTIIS